jgi:DNA ligase D-like protein (predicted ligase)
MAKPAARFLPPMLAEASGAAPKSREGWILEPKLDGLRCIAVRNGADVALYSRNRLSFNSRFPRVVKALGSLATSDFALDGEVVGIYKGRVDFGALQHGNAEAAQYWAFDILWLAGEDLRGLPIEQRKRLLSRVVAEGDDLKVVRVLQGEPAALLRRLCEEGWEGVMAKRAGSFYVEGRSPLWQKLKCGCRQELVIGGFTPPKGTRKGFGALLVGYWEEGKLRYAGKVGTGFSQEDLTEISRALVAIEQASSPFSDEVKERGPRWARPELVAEVAFSNWTEDGRLRQPRFLGLRPDKPSAEVRREKCGPGPLPPARRRGGPGTSARG